MRCINPVGIELKSFWSSLTLNYLDQDQVRDMVNGVKYKIFVCDLEKIFWNSHLIVCILEGWWNWKVYCQIWIQNFVEQQLRIILNLGVQVPYKLCVLCVKHNE